MKLLSLFSLFIMVALSQPSPSHAAPDIAPQPCDTEYWKQMSSRAWMEAQREIMQNQNLIFKPDSVLEYTCFDQFASVAAWEAGDIFTHTEYFGNMIIPRKSNEAMEVAITKVISNALNQYISQSFGHDYLGGRAAHMSIADKDSQIQPATTRVGYTCDVMKNVWQAAKCSNFIDNKKFENTDGFYPFETLKGHNGSPPVVGYNSNQIQETRLFPRVCGAQTNTPGGMQTTTGNFGPQGSWGDQIALAENQGELYPYQTPINNVFTDVGERLEPGNCGQPAIMTGVMIYPDNGEPYEDGICTNPGCRFEKSGTCVSSGS